MNYKHLMAIVIMIVAFAALFSTCSCKSSAGLKANLESARLSWPAVNEDLQRGVQDAFLAEVLTDQSAASIKAQAEKVGLALKNREHDTEAFSYWPSLTIWVDRGIDAQLTTGEIGPTVAEELREQSRLFSEVMARLAEIQ